MYTDVDVHNLLFKIVSQFGFKKILILILL